MFGSVIFKQDFYIPTTSSCTLCENRIIEIYKCDLEDFCVYFSIKSNGLKWSNGVLHLSFDLYGDNQFFVGGENPSAKIKPLTFSNQIEKLFDTRIWF